MRVVILMVAGLLATGPLFFCNSAWALPGEALEQMHVSPPHFHAISGHAHGESRSVAVPCDLSLPVVAPPITVAAPRPATWMIVVEIVDPVTTPLTGVAGALDSSAVSRVTPSTLVHQHMVLLI